jgi:7-cyano-7-deazaguanine synthase
MAILAMNLLLFTGGLDSTALAYMCKPDLLLTVDYGHRSAKGEYRASVAVARELGLQHEVFTVDIGPLGAGTLVGLAPMSDELPPESWPYRNQFLVTLAAMRVAKSGGGTVIIGTVRGDRAHHDGRPEFIKSLDRLLATQQPTVKLAAPAMHMSAEELIRASGVPHPLLGWTFSCHTSPIACGECRGCLKHIETLQNVFAS